MKNPLQSLHDHGQSVWLDYLRRSLITSGELERLIEEDGLRGLTSNPSIFEKAIAGSNDYRDMLEAPESQGIDARSNMTRERDHQLFEGMRTLNNISPAAHRPRE